MTMRTIATTARWTSIAAVCCGVFVLAACSSGEGEPAETGGDGEKASSKNGGSASPQGIPTADEIRKLAEEGAGVDEITDRVMKRTNEAIRERIAQSRGETDPAKQVPLPSVRRLQGLLPESLPGRETVSFDTSSNPRHGMCEAEGNYRPTDSFTNLELRIRFVGMEGIMRQGITYKLKDAEETEVNGYSAYRIEPDSGDREVYVKISDVLYVHAEGPMGLDELTEAVGKVDLAELEKQLDSGDLFKPGFEDRLAEKILGRSDIEKLLPESIGPLQVKEGRSSREVDKEPMQSSVKAQVATGRIEIHDFGTPERARKAVSSDLASAQEIQLFATQYEFTPSESKRDGADVYQLVGTLKQGAARQSMVRVRVFNGRFVVDYQGTWAPAPEEKPNANDNPVAQQLRERMKEQMKAMGVGVFESVDAQVSAVLDALPFDAMKTWNAQEI